MNKLFLFFILLQLQLFCAQGVKEISIVSESWDKLTNTDGTGLYFDLARMIYNPVGVHVKTEIFPYNRTSMMVQKKQADVWLGSYKDEEDYAYYPNYYYDHDIVTAMFKKDKLPMFKNQESLKNLNVCWIRGYDFDEYIKVPFTKHERNSRKAILFSLDKDRFDVFLDAKYDMLSEIEKLKFNTSKYNFVEVFKFKLYPAFRKDKKGKILKEIWDREFKKHLDDGSMKKLYQHYKLEEFYLYGNDNEQ